MPKDRIIGSKTLLRDLFILKAEGEALVYASTYVEIPIEVLDDLQHSYYLYSIHAVGDDSIGLIDFWQTVGAVDPTGLAGGVHAMIDKRKTFSFLPRLEVFLTIMNYTSVDPITVAYKVYRIAGLD